MSRTIFNELGENRVINPRSGSSQFVDLSSNQIIGGIKRFLNNLITNSDVNFNTTANVGRIIFNPNEPGGSGNQIVSIYTTNEIDGIGWIFDSVGNLYYIGGGLAPVKIMLSGGTGDLTILSNFNGFGDIICHNNLISDIINSYSGGDITFNNGIALGSNIINSGNITSNGTISGVDISSTGIIFANDVNLTSTGYLNVNNITSSVASGSYQTKIALSNEFIDINNSSLDIVATYIGFASPAQTLSTASKYMFIKPLSTGNFEMLMNNIANKILISDWTTTKISSQFIWNLNNISNQNAIILDSLTTSSNRLQIYGTPTGTKYLYYNISDELGVIDGSTSQWKITGAGGATLSSLNCGTGLISTTGNISGASITGTTSLITNLINASTGTIKNLIQMDNRFIDTVTGSVDIKSTYVGFPNLTQTLTTASNYMYIKPLTTGDFEMRILNKTKFILKTDIALNAIASQIAWAWMDESNIIHASINPNTTAGTTNNAVFKFYARVVDKSLYFTRNASFGLQNEPSQIVIWRIEDNGDIFTTGTVNANTINPNSGTTISSTSIWNFKNGANIPILLDPTIASGDRLKIYGIAGGTKYLFYSTSNNFGVYDTSTSATVWFINGTTGNINTIGTVNANTINPNSGTTISSTSIWNFKNGANIPILLDPTTASGNRLQIYGVAGDTRYLFFNTSNNIGVFNTATGANVWSIDGTTGAINTIGTLTYSSLSATSFLCNSISPISPSSTINIGATTNFLKSAGVNRILMFPSSTSGDIMQITRTGNDNYNNGYWYWNNSGEHGYISSNTSRWNITAAGLLTTATLAVNSASSFLYCNNFQPVYAGSTYTNTFKLNTLTSNASVSGISLSSEYIDFIHPTITPTTASKYFFIKTTSDGNAQMYINNISGQVMSIQHSSFGIVIRQVVSDYRWVFNALSYTFANQIIAFTIAGTSAGAVIMSSPSTVTYSNSSDYRLKQDITHLDDALDSLMLLKPVIYRMKHDVEAGYNMFFQGFLAHEVQDIIPNIVSGVKDDPNMMQQLDYSKFTPLLTASVQELNKKVEKQQILIDKQQILIDSLIKRLEILENK